MADVNCWLLVLTFLLGIALTLTLTVRRVERDATTGATEDDTAP